MVKITRIYDTYIGYILVNCTTSTKITTIYSDKIRRKITNRVSLLSFLFFIISPFFFSNIQKKMSILYYIILRYNKMILRSKRILVFFFYDLTVKNSNSSYNCHCIFCHSNSYLFHIYKLDRTISYALLLNPYPIILAWFLKRNIINNIINALFNLIKIIILRSI